MAINITIEDIKTWMASLPTLVKADLGEESTAFILGLDKGAMVKIPVALLEGGEAPEEPTEPTVEPRGWWVHKDTDVKTYFDDTANFIDNGIMSRPSWIEDAKEIRLCAGITGFTTSEHPAYYTQTCNVFNYDTSAQTHLNHVLERLDFGEASVVNLPVGLIGNSGGPFVELKLNDTVKTINMWCIFGWYLLNEIPEIRVIIPGEITSMGGELYESYVLAFENLSELTDESRTTFKFYTPAEYMTGLSNMISSTTGSSTPHDVLDIDTLT